MGGILHERCVCRSDLFPSEKRGSLFLCGSGKRSGNSNGGGGGSLPSRREVVEARRGARKRVQLSRRSPFICAAAVSRGIRETSQV